MASKSTDHGEAGGIADAAPPAERPRAGSRDTADGTHLLRAGIRGVAGLILGLLSGVAVVLAFVAYRASVEEVFIHSFGELVGWLGVPALIGPVAGLWAGLVARRAAFWRGAAVLAGAIFAGIVVGAVAGELLTDHASGPWAGGIMGAGAATVLALIAVLATSARTRWATASVAVILAVSCSPPPPAPDGTRVAAVPDSDRVESVVFLLGDPGMARTGSYPVITRMKQDVEGWSAALGPDGDVAVLVLGDILYPDGLQAPGVPRRRTDSLRLASQIEVVSGAAADRAGARMIFIPGNHDWGREEDFAGAIRLLRLRDFLRTWDGAAEGRLSTLPDPGTGGPAVVDLGRRLRLILLDTAWWLLGSSPSEKDAVIQGLRSTLATADRRRTLIAAHHPLNTGGPHGTGTGLGGTYGIRTLLKKAGILLQDLESRPYSDLKRRMLEVFGEVARPDVFAGGHDHSLQVFATPETAGRGLVVGSASKLTEVRSAPGMLFGRSEPGYGTILVLDDGTMHIRIEAAPERFLSCDEAEGPECLSRGVDAYRTVWAENLPPSP